MLENTFSDISSSGQRRSDVHGLLFVVLRSCYCAPYVFVIVVALGAFVCWCCVHSIAPLAFFMFIIDVICFCGWDVQLSVCMFMVRAMGGVILGQQTALRKTFPLMRFGLVALFCKCCIRRPIVQIAIQKVHIQR